MSKLYIMMGAPGSGKSTFIENHLNYDIHKWISRDMIRFSIVSENEEYFSKEKEVFKEYIRRINECLNRGWDVFADATHLNKASRNKLIRSLNLQSVSSIEVIWIKTPLEECLKRNKKREGTRAYVPETAIRNMHASIEAPEFEEGIDVIYIVEDGKPIKTIRRMEELKNDVSN